MSIDQTLRKYLPVQNFFEIKGSVLQTNRLFNGITYQSPEGKVWNIRMCWDKNIADDVTGVFIRIHSSETFYALWSTGDDSKKFQSRAIQYTDQKLTEVNKEDTYTFLSQALKGITLDDKSPVPEISLACYEAIKGSDFFQKKGAT